MSREHERRPRRATPISNGPLYRVGEDSPIEYANGMEFGQLVYLRYSGSFMVRPPGVQVLIWCPLLPGMGGDSGTSCESGHTGLACEEVELRCRPGERNGRTFSDSFIPV